ncbi:MAG: biotin--[acetyl-CoA-carboxylase] ligase [Flammeovirgaceae bacterium]
MNKIIANTLFIGKKQEYLPTCHSTNDFLADMVRSSSEKQQFLEEGLLVFTSQQTKGKGQRGNSWEAAPYQNLTFSVYLKPTFLFVNQQFYLNIAIALGIIDFLNTEIQKGFQVKWSNDIYYGNQKLGGILIENELNIQRIENSIVGIGLNVNQAKFNFENAHYQPTSLSIITQHTYRLEKILSELLNYLEKRYLQLRAGKLDALKQDYLQNLYWYQEEHEFEDLRNPSKSEVFVGQILGIDKDGRLIISKENKLQYFDFKEVKFLR